MKKKTQYFERWPPMEMYHILSIQTCILSPNRFQYLPVLLLEPQSIWSIKSNSRRFFKKIHGNLLWTYCKTNNSAWAEGERFKRSLKARRRCSGGSMSSPVTNNAIFCWTKFSSFTVKVYHFTVLSTSKYSVFHDLNILRQHSIFPLEKRFENFGPHWPA